MNRKLTAALAFCLGLALGLMLLNAIPAKTPAAQIANLLKEEGIVTVLESHTYGSDCLLLFQTESGQLGLATGEQSEKLEVTWARTADSLLERYQDFWTGDVQLNGDHYQFFLRNNEKVESVWWSTWDGTETVYPFQGTPDLLLVSKNTNPQGDTRHTYYALDAEGNRLHS